MTHFFIILILILAPFTFEGSRTHNSRKQETEIYTNITNLALIQLTKVENFELDSTQSQRIYECSKFSAFLQKDDDQFFKIEFTPIRYYTTHGFRIKELENLPSPFFKPMLDGKILNGSLPGIRKLKTKNFQNYLKNYYSLGHKVDPRKLVGKLILLPISGACSRELNWIMGNYYLEPDQVDFSKLFPVKN